MSRLIRLRGKTHKGKNRIRTWGEWWRVTEEMSHAMTIVACRDQTDDGSGELPDSWRRVCLNGDPDFEIVEEK